MQMVVAASVPFVVTLTIYLLTAAPTITERFGGVDGGELAATALSGGVPHPSGYPTYMILARIALALVPGEPAYALAVLSAISMAVAAACTGLFVLHLAPVSAHSSFHTVAPAVYAGSLFGLSPRSWSQAIIPEVYAVYLAFFAGACLLVLVWLKYGNPSIFVAACGVVGIGSGAHLTVGTVAVAMVVVLITGRHRLSMRQLGLGLCAFVVGCAIYACLPLWGARGAIPSWGDFQTVGGFWQHVTGAEYRYLVGIVPWSERLGRISFAARDVFTQLGVLGSAVVLWGGFSQGWNHQRVVMLFTGCIALVSIAFAVSYGAADGTVYLLPWTWCWCVWVGLGVYAIQESLTGQRMRLAFLTLLVAVLGVTTVWRYPALNLRGDTSARDRATTRLERIDPDALLLTSDDAPTFGTWYVQTALGVRQDVVVVDVRLLDRPWYVAQLRRRLSLSAATPLCDALRGSDRPVYGVEQNGGAMTQTNGIWSSTVACTP